MSPVLFHNQQKTVWVLDIPRSIEESQIFLQSGQPVPRRLISAPPIHQPFSTPEPRDGISQDPSSLAAQLSELMTAAHVSSALEELCRDFTGPWCLPRISRSEQHQIPRTTQHEESREEVEEEEYHDHEDSKLPLKPSELLHEELNLPPGAKYLLGTIQDLRQEFIVKAPRFDMIILDPPWPNRSARRKQGSYSTATNTDSIRELLCSVPVAAKLNPEGLVAVWITNKPSLIELLTSPRGVFAAWGVELLDIWTWLKVTTAGVPIFDVESQWRKPWEKILIARRNGSGRTIPNNSRVLVCVPDIHSRKPNLRALFEDILPGEPCVLEIFARNLTAGWWAWGDEALRYQYASHWVEESTKQQAPKYG